MDVGARELAPTFFAYCISYSLRYPGGMEIAVYRFKK